MPPKKRDAPFQPHHVAEFGLTAVVTMACRFCEVFGKEESEVGMKHGRSERVKYFKAPFRKENYSSHHTRMHRTQWAEYRELEASAKNSFFDNGTISGSQTTMHAFVAPRTPQVSVLIDKDIVNVIIGEMMFHPEDMDEIIRARLLESFVPTLDSSEDATNAGDVIMETKEVLGIESIGSCSEGIVSHYVRFICAMNLQCIAELLRQCWAFSVALDMATHMATSYCDVRIRICHKSTVHDFHLLSIPEHERHTGEIIFNTFAKAMDALFLDWRETIIGASSDGEKKMTGRHQGVITRIHRVAKPGFMRVWCRAHQLDLCMQSFYLAIPDTFYSTFTLLVAYLCRQQNFISDKRSQCPLIYNTRWLNMIKRTEDNEAYINAAPDILPHQLVRILPRDFCVYLQRHKEHLDYTFSNEEIENIGRQHKALCDSYRRQPDVKSSIDNFNDSAAYCDVWISLQNTYPLLEKFVGGLATIFPGTSTVENDFSVVKYEKNKNRMSLTHASLKGILHAKQYRCMHSLKV
ncbi:hypothetical protein CY35_01G142300 [Sphagnum magellanicum]|nr:hypothetical protein CY35_01G142300 [Sphagnum magellanicum]